MWHFPRICGGDPNKDSFLLFFMGFAARCFFCIFFTELQNFFFKVLDKTERMFYNFKCQFGKLSYRKVPITLVFRVYIFS